MLNKNTDNNVRQEKSQNIIICDPKRITKDYG